MRNLYNQFAWTLQRGKEQEEARDEILEENDERVLKAQKSFREKERKIKRGLKELLEKPEQPKTNFRWNDARKN